VHNKTPYRVIKKAKVQTIESYNNKASAKHKWSYHAGVQSICFIKTPKGGHTLNSHEGGQNTLEGGEGPRAKHVQLHVHEKQIPRIWECSRAQYHARQNSKHNLKRKQKCFARSKAPKRLGTHHVVEAKGNTFQNRFKIQSKFKSQKLVEFIFQNLLRIGSLTNEDSCSS
jgi:hypothetical protein